MPQRYRPLIAPLFGTIEHAMFPQPGRNKRDREVAEVSGLDMVELLQRLRTSDVDGATLDALRITIERLCCEYPHLPANQLGIEGRRWLEHLVGLQSQRLSLAQHREVLNLAGWLALLMVASNPTRATGVPRRPPGRWPCRSARRPATPTSTAGYTRCGPGLRSQPATTVAPSTPRGRD
jgi:hypothetical protein